MRQILPACSRSDRPGVARRRATPGRFGFADGPPDQPVIRLYLPAEKSPSVPKITAFLCCWARFRPNCWALAATCHGSTTTEVDAVTLGISEEKSVSFCDTDSWSTLIPAAWNTGVMASTRPVEY